MKIITRYTYSIIRLKDVPVSWVELEIENIKDLYIRIEYKDNDWEYKIYNELGNTDHIKEIKTLEEIAKKVCYKLNNYKIHTIKKDELDMVISLISKRFKAIKH